MGHPMRPGIDATNAQGPPNDHSYLCLSRMSRRGWTGSAYSGSRASGRFGRMKVLQALARPRICRRVPIVGGIVLVDPVVICRLVTIVEQLCGGMVDAAPQ